MSFIIFLVQGTVLTVGVRTMRHQLCLIVGASWMRFVAVIRWLRQVRFSAIHHCRRYPSWALRVHRVVGEILLKT